MSQLGHPSDILPLCRGAQFLPCLSFWQRSRSHALPGVQGKGEGGINLKGEGEGSDTVYEGLALARPKTKH